MSFMHTHTHTYTFKPSWTQEPPHSCNPQAAPSHYFSSLCPPPFYSSSLTLAELISFFFFFTPSFSSFSCPTCFAPSHLLPYFTGQPEWRRKLRLLTFAKKQNKKTQTVYIYIIFNKLLLTFIGLKQNSSIQEAEFYRSCSLCRWHTVT